MSAATEGFVIIIMMSLFSCGLDLLITLVTKQLLGNVFKTFQNGWILVEMLSFYWLFLGFPNGVSVSFHL